jgi:hypothetical protein
MTTTWPDWLQELHVRLDGESPGEHIARIVRALDGVSLVHERERLEQLFRANEQPDREAIVASWQTNCASAARAILALAGVEPQDAALLAPLEVGEAMARLRGGCERARLPATEWRRLGPGWLMVYWHTGNDAHAEWCLTVPDAYGRAMHGGGGRSQNAITVQGPSDIRWSLGRPLQEIYDPAQLATNPARGDNPY